MFFITRDITARKIADDLLRRSEGELRRRNDIINRELEEARRVQQILLPQLFHSDIIDMQYRYMPMAQVGGDYFSCTLLQEYNGIGIFVGDVAGHGVSAALYSFLVKSLTDKVCRQCGISPKEYLKNLNTELIRGMKGNYLTGIYGIFLPGKKKRNVTFTFSKGGHPFPILYRPSTGDVEMIRIKGTALGIFEQIVYEEKTVELEKGDRIFLYTDGLPETVDLDRRMLEYDGLMEMIRDANKTSRPLNDVLDIIVKNLDDFRANAPLEDDMLLIGVEAKGG